MKRYYFYFLPLFLLCLSACSKCAGDKVKTIVLVEDPALVNNETSKLLSEELSGADPSKPLVVADEKLVATPLLLAFYQQAGFSVSWTDKGTLTPQGDTLFSILENAEEYGLIPNDYHFAAIGRLLKAAKDSTGKKMNAAGLRDADLLLTDAAFKFTVHASKGRLNADSLSPEWHPEKLDTNLVVLLINARRTNTIRGMIGSLEPQNAQYQGLKLALKRYREEFKASYWDSLASRESDSATFNARLVRRLAASHDYYNDTAYSDSVNLLKAIRNFQCRHNLTEDGKIGKLTFKALQQTKRDVIHQIEMNMERWRWRDAPPDFQYVWVNIPKFEMHVVEADTLVMVSRVIVGEPEKETPLLKSTITNFLIYPYWTVPFSIATKELLPVLKRDTSYLRRKNFEVLDGNNHLVDPHTINWKRYSKTYFPWKLRQKTGDENSLGILKFNFNNKYGVYMHDTDNRRLFGREMRALSHGCVRLEKFVDFASFLIRDDSLKYPKDSLMVDLLQEKQKYVYIRHPINIYINYYTAEVDAYGEILFFNDIYKRDEKMLKALSEK